MRTRLARWLGLAALAAAALAPIATLPARADALSAIAPERSDKPLDRIILRNGKIIEGRVLSETATKVKIMVMVGGISAPVTYQKSDVLSIERGVVEAAQTSERATAGVTPSENTSNARPQEKTNRAGAARVYLMKLKGDLGRDISYTPLKKAMDDAIASNPDVIVIKLDAGSFPPGFDGLWTAEKLGPIIENAIDSGHRVVFWVKRAQAGAAFLPLISPEIYFTSDGTLGGVGDLSGFDIGDDMVNLKQISLRIGHAEGFAITGGYEPKLIRAMALKDEWLAVRIRGGEPEYITWKPRPEDGEGWTVLTDDGKGKNKDEFSFEGNDVLTLDADWAFRLHVARGVVDTLDDLVFELDIGRDYVVIDGKSGQILKSWHDRIERSLDQIKKIRRDLKERTTGRNETASLGRRINLLKQMRSILTAYEEVFDPDGGQRAKIDVQIEQIRQQIRDASKSKRRRR